MAWRKNEDGEETIFESQARNLEEIHADLSTMVERMLKNKDRENASHVKSLLLFTNATNGYIRLVWFDPEQQKAQGTYLYYLELPVFSDISIEHEDGAFYFDNQTHIAICMITEDIMDNNDFPDDFEVYTMDELNTTPELLLI